MTLMTLGLKGNSCIMEMVRMGVVYNPISLNLFPQVAIKTNLHQSIVVITGCILIKTSYTVAEGKEMYFAQIKIVFKIRNTYEFGHKHTVINSIFTR
jgi:hypothetical protein